MDNSKNNQSQSAQRQVQLPVVPVPQPVPPQPTPGMPYQMPPKKKMSKGALWGIIGGSIGLIVLIVGIVLAVIFLGGPSKADYQAAQEKMNSIITKYNKVSSSLSYISTSETKSSLESNRDKITTAKGDINKALTDLGKMKAVTNDKEVREKYDNIKNRLEKFNEVMDALGEVYGKLLPAMSEYTSTSSSYNISNLATSIKKTKQDLKNADIKHEYNKKFVKDFTEQLEKMEEMLPKIIEMRSDYKKYDSSYMTEFYTINTKIQKIAREWQSNMQKIGEEGELRNELNSLEDILVDKVNK